MKRSPTVSVFALLFVAASVVASGQSLSYHGELTSSGLPAHGNHDFKIRLYDGPEPSSSTQIGSEITLEGVSVRDGRLDIDLPYDPTETQSRRVWLEIEVARGDRVGGFTLLEPRQPLDTGEDESREAYPPGAIVFFDLATCPTGWSEFTAARGRALVGVGPGGVLQGAVGQSLADQESRTHQHSFSPTLATTNAGLHNHAWADLRRQPNGDVAWISYTTGGSETLAFAWGNGIGNEGSGYYPMAAQPVQTFFTSKNGSHSHSVISAPTTSESGTLPYVQLLACQKG